MPVLGSDLQLIDDAFNEDVAAHGYHLSLEIDSRQFSYAVLDLINKKYIAFGASNYHFNSNDALSAKISDTISGSDILTRSYKSVSAAFCGNISTLVPVPFFDLDNAAAYLRFNHGVEEELTIKSEELLNLGAQNVYAIEPYELDIINRFFPTAVFQHLSTGLIEQIVIHSKSQKQTRVFCNFRKDTFQVVIVNNGKLLFYNSFQHHSAEDVAYYLLFTFEQMGLDHNDILVTLSGMMEEEKITALLKKYIKRVAFTERTSSFGFSDKLSGIPSHVGWTLFNQYLCV